MPDLSLIIRRLALIYAICLGLVLIGLLGADDWLAGHGPAMRTWFYNLPPWIVLLVKKGLYVFYFGFGLTALWALWRRNRRMGWACLAYLIGQLVFSLILVRIFKIVIGRPRPIAADLSYWPLTFDGDHNALPSGHTADAFTAVGVIDNFAASRWFKITVVSLAVLISASRIIQFEHYLSDLAVGAFIGYSGATVAVIYLGRWFGRKNA